MVVQQEPEFQSCNCFLNGILSFDSRYVCLGFPITCMCTYIHRLRLGLEPGRQLNGLGMLNVDVEP